MQTKYPATEDGLFFNNEESESKYYGINGCLCIKCVNERILREYTRIQNPQKEEEFKERLEEMKEAITITEIAKRRYGLEINYLGLSKCIFHEDKTPSLKFYNKTSSFYCFGCGTKGDVIEFIERMEANKPKDTARLIITKEQRYRILSEQKWRCNKCGCKLAYSRNHAYGEEVAHIDHIHPYSKRSTYTRGRNNINERANLQALCEPCNLKKHDHK